MKKILMCAENMDGHKLEDLLWTLVEEIQGKSENIAKLDLPQASTTIRSNSKIIKLLIQAREIQVETMKIHDAVRANSVQDSCDHDWEDMGAFKQCTYPECQKIKGN